MLQYVGHHINTYHGFISSVNYAKSIGANLFQIFLSSPRSYKVKPHTDEELNQLAEQLKLNNMKIVVHGNYMLNFCNDISSDIHQKAIKSLCQDLTESAKINALGVVIHMGKKLKLDENVAINNYVLGIKKVLSLTKNTNSTIILETGAGVGTEVCTMIPDLKSLYDKFTDREKQRIKFCIDTCHVFSAGYDLGDENYIDEFDKLIQNSLTWDKISCIHLNDSKNCCNSRKDNHEDITQGFIKNGLKKFVKLCSKYNIPIVLETPCDNITKENQIKLVKKWINEK